MTVETSDILIVGAGLSGVGIARDILKTHPNKKIIILEGRSRVGGTWDLFKYPGIRSDSDMCTMGYKFRPWRNQASIASGESIRQYIEDSAVETGVYDLIQFMKSVKSANFDSKTRRWTTVCEDGSFYESQFLFLCAGYFRYAEGYRPEFPEEKSFKGKFIHPQHWPENLEIKNKNIAIIGSGATSVTLAPTLCEQGANKVYVIQRSPSYVFSLPRSDNSFLILAKFIPEFLASTIIRWRNITLFFIFVRMCYLFPNFMRAKLLGFVETKLGKEQMVHFSPKYNPWEQRLCLIPDDDLFNAIKSRKVQMVTGKINKILSDGILMDDLTEVRDLDYIITATGLNVAPLGSIPVSVDGELVKPQNEIMYKSLMLSNLPNFCSVMGYVNATWTLKVDLCGRFLNRVLSYMDNNNYEVFCPRAPVDVRKKAKPFDAMNSSYFNRAKHLIPMDAAYPWCGTHNYFADYINMVWKSVNDSGMQWTAFEKK